MIQIELKGLEQLQRKLGLTKKALRDAFENAVAAEMGAIMNAAQKTVPVITGRLRSSAYVRRVPRNQHRSDMRMGYDAPYAVFVHERPEGRGYKWLERAAQRVGRGMFGRFRAKLQATIARMNH